MTGKLVNLRQERKRRARTEKATRADASAVRHGLDRSTASLVTARQQKAERDLDGKKRD